jgi:microfibrillar-associated protein 1
VPSQNCQTFGVGGTRSEKFAEKRANLVVSWPRFRHPLASCSRLANEVHDSPTAPPSFTAGGEGARRFWSLHIRLSGVIAPKDIPTTEQTVKMPPPSSRMTKNRLQTTRYFPGKAEVADPVSDEESEEEEEQQQQPAPKAPAPKATSFPAGKRIDLSRAGQLQSRAPEPVKQPEDDLDGFVTASESSEEEDGDSDEDDEDESSEEEDSSDDEPKRPMLRPTFISKAKRAQQASNAQKSVEELAEEEERKRKQKADELLQAQLEKDAAARAAGKKAWDDDDNIEDEVDDTDDLDPEAEKAAWKLRELKRVRRERLAIEAKEKEREEIERRRNMSAEEREAEDRAFLEAQKEEREGKGKMGFMQKYFHKGAFFGGGDDDEEMDVEVKAVLNRDLAGARFEDETGDKGLLPEYMRIRDMSKLGRKGRTKYKDLKGEDTGRWGDDFGRKRREREGEGLDERFQSDERFRPDDRRDGGGGGGTSANAIPVGERRRREGDSGGGREEKRTRYD